MQQAGKYTEAIRKKYSETSKKGDSITKGGGGYAEGNATELQQCSKAKR